MSVLKQSIAGTEPHLYEVAASPPGAQTTRKKPPTRALVDDPLMTAEEVAGRLNVSTDWVTFQVIRRTIATLAQKKGTVKDVQGVMRHSRLTTTTDVYMQEIPESVQSTINSINEELRGTAGLKRKKPVRAGAVGKSRRTSLSRLTPNDTKSRKGGSAYLPAYI